MSTESQRIQFEHLRQNRRQTRKRNDRRRRWLFFLIAACSIVPLVIWLTWGQFPELLNFVGPS